MKAKRAIMTVALLVLLVGLIATMTACTMGGSLSNKWFNATQWARKNYWNTTVARVDYEQSLTKLEDGDLEFRYFTRPENLNLCNTVPVDCAEGEGIRVTANVVKVHMPDEAQGDFILCVVVFYEDSDGAEQKEFINVYNNSKSVMPVTYFLPAAKEGCKITGMCFGFKTISEANRTSESYIVLNKIIVNKVTK